MGSDTAGCIWSDGNFYNNVYFNHVKDGHSNEKNSGAIKTLVRVAVNSDYPNTTKEKGIQQRTGKQTVAYRFHKDINKLVD